MIRSLVVSSLLLVPASAVAQGVPEYTPPPNRQGITFEANLGIGLLQISGDGGSDSETALGGLDLGIGVFLNPRMAITLRIAGVTYSEDGGSITQAFAGPSLQYWVAPSVWIGGGLGLGVARLTIDGLGSESESGFALDLRAGYTFNPTRKHSFNVSVEVTPAFIEDARFTGLAVLGGYQFM